MPSPINLTLDGTDGNSFAIMAAFKKQARKEGWTKEEVENVLDEAMKSDYAHLIETILNNCDPQD